MAKNVVIVGAGGHGQVIADIVENSGDKVVGFLDDGQVEEQNGFRILGKIDDLDQYISCAEIIVGIGDSEIRERIMRHRNIIWYTAIHPTVSLGRDVRIGEGTAVMANVVINSRVIIGRGCILNTASTIDHDNEIGDYSHISVGAHTAGSVKIGTKTFLGIGSVVINNVNICENCIIGAGTVVIDDIKEDGTYVGVPAHKIK